MTSHETALGADQRHRERAVLVAFKSTYSTTRSKPLPITPTTALDGGEYDYDQNYDDIYDDIGGIYDSCDDYNYNYDSDPADDR